MDLHCITSLPITGLCSQQFDPSSPLSVFPLSLSPISALTVHHPLQSTPLLNTLKHACTHTPTDFQNKNPAVYQVRESRMESHFAFQRVFEVPAQMLLSSFFIFISCKRSSPCSFSPPRSAQCDTRSLSLIPPPSLHLCPHDHREKVLSDREAFFEKLLG